MKNTNKLTPLGKVVVKALVDRDMTQTQADNIYRTNVQTAYNAGHYERMTDPDVTALRPYWEYVAVDDGHSRPAHLAMNGLVARHDSPIWDTWYPPNGYRCRCTVRTLSQRQVEERGLKVYEEVPDRAELPDGRFTTMLPDRRFGTNAAKARYEPDLTGYPDALVKAFERMKP